MLGLRTTLGGFNSNYETKDFPMPTKAPLESPKEAENYESA